MLIGAGAAVVLIVVAIVLGFVLTGGKSSSGSTPARGSLVNALPSAAEVNDNLKGIPQNGNVLGSPNAPVTLAEYIDLQCPACQQFETQAMPELIRRYVRTGKVKVEARPIAFIGPDSADRPRGCARRRQAEPVLQLQPAPLLQPGNREHGLAERGDDQVRRPRAFPASTSRGC